MRSNSARVVMLLRRRGKRQERLFRVFAAFTHTVTGSVDTGYSEPPQLLKVDHIQPRLLGSLPHPSVEGQHMSCRSRER
jgi:hypothetical protein